MLSVIAKFQTTLAAGISAAATSLTLVSDTSNDSTTIPTGLYGFVIDEGNANEEYVIGTVSSTAVTSLLRGVSYEDGITEITANKKTHRKGATIKITDHPALIQIIKILNGITTITNLIKSSAVPLADNDIANKKYVDDHMQAGGADASTTVKGIAKLSTAPASPTDPIAAGDNDPRLPSTDEKAALAGLGTPSATSKFISEAGIAGVVLPYAGASAPTGFLICNGGAISRTTYARLFAIIGETYGSGDGSTTFNIPNLKGKIPVGVNAAETEFDLLGETGGEKTHALSDAEMPSHTHSLARSGGGSGDPNTGPASGQITPATNFPAGTIGDAGSDAAHNNLQPYIALNYIIKT